MVKRYQSGKQKPQTKEQTVQWSKDTKVLSVLRFTASVYHRYLLTIVLSVLWFTASVYHFGIF
jgi:hypothetical protein